jgi:nucleoside-diphosphate-sugar epimerase
VADDRATGRIYHVAEPPETEREWVQRLAAVTGWNGEIFTRPNADLPDPLRLPYDFQQDWSLDSTRIRRELGYAEVTPPREAMRRTVEWERANPPEPIDAAQFDYAAEDAAIASA